MDFLIKLLRAAARHGSQSTVLAVFCLFAIPASVHAAEGDSLEYTVKAAYLTKFGIYVEWPEAVFAAPGNPINLCVIGEDPFGSMLDTAAAAQRIDNRAIAVRRLKAVARDSACHVLYIGASEAARVTQIVELLRGTPVLTVSDTRGNANAGPVISFVLKDNRVRFTIDEEAAAQNGLNISSKLLGLALSVKPKSAREAK